MNTKAVHSVLAVATALFVDAAGLLGAPNCVPNGDFEVGYGHGMGSSQQDRTYALSDTWDTTQARHGKACMKVPAWGRLVTRALQVAPGKTYTISAWVKPKSPCQFSLSLYNTGLGGAAPAGQQGPTRLNQRFELKGGWQRVSLSGVLMEYPSPDYHVMVAAFAADIWVDELQLEEGTLTEYAPKTPLEIGLVCDKPSNIFSDGERAAMELLAHNGTRQPATCKISYEVYDFLNRKVKTGSVDAAVPAGQTWRGSMDLDTGRKGVFRVVLWVDGMNGTDEEVAYSVVHRPKVAGPDPTSAIGIHASPADSVLSAMQKLGIKWDRSLSPAPWFRWERVEMEKGKFVWYDDEVRRMVDHGFPILGCIHGQAAWALQDAPAAAATQPAPAGKVVLSGENRPTRLLDLDAWEAYVFAVVEHYKPYVHYWEVCNEPIWEMRTSAYCDMLTRATRAIRRADPKAKIVGMGGSYDYRWQLKVIEELGKKPKEYMDAISTHLYPPGSDPFNPSHDTRGLDYHDKIIVPHQIEVWNTETGPWCGGIYQGPNSDYRCMGERPEQANRSLEVFFRGFNFEAERTVYNFMHTVGNGMTKYFYYDARLFQGPDYYATHCTILHYDETIRTKGIAYAVLAWLFDHSKGLGNLTAAPVKGKADAPGAAGRRLGDVDTNQVYAYLFDRGGVPVVGIWSADTKNRTLSLPLDASQFKAYDMMGNEVKPAGAAVSFGRGPVYLEGQGKLAVEQMKAAVQNAQVVETPDKTPPNLSISECPRGQITDTAIRVRWIGIDDTFVPAVKGQGDPKAVTYSYRLVGRDKDWFDWTPTVVAFYKNLTPGTYRLEVKARDRDGNTCEPTVREFTVAKAPKDPLK